MCKIVLKYSDLHGRDISEHRENIEEGAGFAWMLDNHLHASISMKHKDAFNGYNANYHTHHKHKSPFSLFHSRLPSAGKVCKENIQPFVSDKFAFAHNGTVDLEKVIWACASMGIDIEGSESDSNLMFKMMHKIPFRTMIALLKSTEDNYIIVNKETDNIHIIGQWELLYYKIPKGYKRLFSAKNDHYGDTYHIITTLDGTILSSVIDKESKFTYKNYQEGDFIGDEDDDEGIAVKEKEVDTRPVVTGYKYSCFKKDKGTDKLCELENLHKGPCNSEIRKAPPTLKDWRSGSHIKTWCNKWIPLHTNYCWREQGHPGECDSYACDINKISGSLY